MSSINDLIFFTQEIRQSMKDIDTLASSYSADMGIDSYINSLSSINVQLERNVIKSRNILELLQPSVEYQKANAAKLPYMHISGTVRVFNYNWIHVKLNTLLPNCRYQTPAYLSDTITRLLDDYCNNKGQLPYYNHAMMIIDEHCNVNNRTVYDQDNKGWKAISNAIKGRLVQDDDQFSLSISLVSKKSETPECHIFIIDIEDTSYFFCLRDDGSIYW